MYNKNNLLYILFINYEVIVIFNEKIKFISFLLTRFILYFQFFPLIENLILFFL